MCASIQAQLQGVDCDGAACRSFGVATCGSVTPVSEHRLLQSAVQDAVIAACQHTCSYCIFVSPSCSFAAWPVQSACSQGLQATCVVLQVCCCALGMSGSGCCNCTSLSLISFFSRRCMAPEPANVPHTHFKEGYPTLVATRPPIYSYSCIAGTFCMLC